MSDFSDDRLRALYAAHAANAPDTPHPDADQLADAALGRGPEAARLAVFDHALSCATCRRELELLEVTSRAGEVLQRRHRWVAVSLAIAAVIVVAIAVPTISGKLWRQVRAPASEDVDRGAPGVAGPRLLTVIGPAGTVAPGTTPAFAWHPAPRIALYVLEIVDDTGFVVSRSRTTDTTAPWPSLARGGRYRWRVSGTTSAGVQWQSAFTDLTVPSQ